jgi:GH15 family glucan-1,4-alpha-glucosidase
MNASSPALERSGARKGRKTIATDIGDYALIGDCETGALVSSQGSIDWLCWPRFDSDACLAALLGDEGCGCWRMIPRQPVLRTERRYRPDTLVLETRMATVEGSVQLLDFMPIRGATSDIVRIVVGESGQVHMRMKLGLRFDYGRARPSFTRLNEHLAEAIGGPHAVTIQASTTVALDDGHCICDFLVRPGQRAAFVARYRPSHWQRPALLDAEQALQSTEQAWRDWSSRCTYIGPWRDAVIRSLITL